MRICSFFPTATELLYALEAGRSVVGRSERCDFPPAARHTPIVVRSRIASARLDSRGIHEAVQALRTRGEHQYDIDTALLRRLHPDLVVTQELCSVCAASHPEVLDAIRQLPDPPATVSVSARRFEELFTSIEALGEATGRVRQAEALTARLRREVDRIKRRVRQARTAPRVWCCEWLDPLMAAGHWIPELVAMAGGVDGLGRPGEDSRQVTWEEVRHYDPEVILVMPCSFSLARTAREFPRLTRLPGWGAVRAVRNGQVLAVEGGWFHRPGPRLIAGLHLMATLFHPRLFPKPPASQARLLRTPPR